MAEINIFLAPPPMYSTTYHHLFQILSAVKTLGESKTPHQLILLCLYPPSQAKPTNTILTPLSFVIHFHPFPKEFNGVKPTGSSTEHLLCSDSYGLEARAKPERKRWRKEWR